MTRPRPPVLNSNYAGIAPRWRMVIFRYLNDVARGESATNHGTAGGDIGELRF